MNLEEMDNGNAEAEKMEKEGVWMPVTPGKLIFGSVGSASNLDESRGLCESALFNGCDSAVEHENLSNGSEDLPMTKLSREFHGNAASLVPAATLASLYNDGIKELFVMFNAPSTSTAAPMKTGGMPRTPSPPPRCIQNASSNSFTPGNLASVSAAFQRTDDLLNGGVSFVLHSESENCVISQGTSSNDPATGVFQDDSDQNRLAQRRDEIRELSTSVCISTPQIRRRENGLSKGKMPRQKERKKKLIPKVAKDVYSINTSKVSTPKPWTPKPLAPKRPNIKKIPQEKRKQGRKSGIETSAFVSDQGQVAKKILCKNRDYARKSGIEVPAYSLEEREQAEKNTPECKRTLNFNLDYEVGHEDDGLTKATFRHDPIGNKTVENICSQVLCQSGNNPGDGSMLRGIVYQYQCQRAGTTTATKGNELILEKSKSITDGLLVKSVIDQNKCKISNKSAPLKIYQRKLRKKQCLKNTGLVPNCPMTCKKRRMRRKKGTMWLSILDKNGEIDTKIGQIKGRQARLDEPEHVFSLLSLLPVIKSKKKRSKLSRGKPKVPLLGDESGVPIPGSELVPIPGSELSTELTRGKPMVPTKRKRSARFRRPNDRGCCLGNLVTPGAKSEGSTIHKNVPTSQEILLDILPCIWLPEIAAPPLNTRKGWDGACEEARINIITQQLQHPCINDNQGQLVMCNQNHIGSVVSKCGGRKSKFLPKGDLGHLVTCNRNHSASTISKRSGWKPEYLSKDYSGQLVMYNQNHGALVTSKPRKSKDKPKVVLDSETLRVWNSLMHNDGIEAAEANKDQVEFWEKERELFRCRVDSFIASMHLIQGDRRFSPWKGSVVDSAVGVFLTQNVSDHLSSSAFMRLAARFPPKSVNDDMDDTGNGACSQESVGSNNGVAMKYMVFEPDDDMSCLTDSRNISSTSSSQIISEAEAEDVGVVKDADCRVGSENSKNDEKKTCDDDMNCLIDSRNISITSASQIISEAEAEDVGVVKDADCRVGSTNSKNDEKQTCDSQSQSTSGRNKKIMKKNRSKKQKEAIDWDDLRKSYSKDRTTKIAGDTMDSVDWEAVRCAEPGVVAEAIKKRGQHKELGEKIQAFLNRILKDHGKIDLEWLRDVPPDKVKDYLLSVYGLGLKSVECVRLLTLHHVAFPVDVNVGRVAVRLGWVPLQRLPDQVLIHLLDNYPLVDDIQKFLWPRLCKLDQRTLYELHYQLITFGKVFCTKRLPNCNSCPMRGDCKHFASAFASTRLSLPWSPEDGSTTSVAPASVSRAQVLITSTTGSVPEIYLSESSHYEPIIEYPPSPEQKSAQKIVRDIEDCCDSKEDEIPTIRIDSGGFRENLLSFLGVNEILVPDEHETTAVVPWMPGAASIPAAKWKDEKRLRTEHEVYVLPDQHPLLAGFEKRESDDPCPYLLAIWMPGEDARPSKQANVGCCFQELQSYDSNTCFSCSDNQEGNFKMVAGTILIPCRTAMRGRFPLNGTYFQVNEVFADHESTVCPIYVPRALIWHLPRTRLYCGSSTSSVFKELATEQIQRCFWLGFVCVRAFNRTTREPVELANKFHVKPEKRTKNSRTYGVTAEEKVRKERVRAEEKARKERVRAEEKARKERDRAEEKAIRERARAEEKARRERARAEEKERRERIRAEEKVRKESHR